MHDPEQEREARRYTNPIASRTLILSVMEGIGEPLGFKRLAKELALETATQREALQNRLRAMVREGQLVVDRRNVYAIASRMDLVRGRVVGHVEGFGFLVPEDDETDVFLNHRQMRAVFHGDIALVRIRGFDRRGRPEGEIVEVLEHRTDYLVGRLYHENRTWFLDCLSNRICQEVLVQVGDGQELNPGQIVRAKVVEQPTAHGIPSCEVTEYLGEHLTTEVEVTVSLLNHGIPSIFSNQTLDEVNRLESGVSSTESQDRADLTQLPFVTIDGPDARDFDDAIFCESRREGGWHLMVAIADVAHYVRRGSALDDDAIERGTSVYFPQNVVPMLPEALSNELCSLKPNVKRLVLVCDMLISAQGRISRYQFYEGVISSHARLTYEEVAAGPSSGPYDESLAAAAELTRQLLESRSKRGALEFESAELVFATDETGRVESVDRRTRNFAHRIVEECMLCANVSAARLIEKSDRTGMYRVHDRPNEEKVKALRRFLEALNIPLPSGILSPGDFQGILDELKARPNGSILQTAVLRTLSQAVYQLENRGHFGLNYSRYTHYTSPIRRYPDLMTHRLIKSLVHSREASPLVRRFGTGESVEYDYEDDELEGLAAHCSMTERRAETAVYEVLDWMKCEYVSQFVGETLEGIVTGVTSFGLFVELRDVHVEGLVHISSLINDYYEFDSRYQLLFGRQTRSVFGMGDNVTVQVTRVSVDERKVDFDLLEHQPIKRKRIKPESGKERGPRRPKKRLRRG